MTPAERERLILEHLGLVRTVAARVHHGNTAVLDYDDLIQHGIVGLIEAADRYRPVSGVPFVTFARHRVRGTMLDAMRSLDFLTRHQRELGRDAAPPCSLDALLGDETQELTVADMIADPHGMDTDQIAARLDLPGPLRQLQPRERMILAMWFGAGLRLTAIAQYWRCSTHRCWHIRNSSLAKLRLAMDGANWVSRETRSWSAADDTYLLAHQGTPAKMIAPVLGRTPEAIRLRRRRLRRRDMSAP